MHKPVLLHEVVEGLSHLGDDSAKKIFVDATYGGGGHSREVLRRYPNLQTIAIDQDPEVGEAITGNFRNLDRVLAELGVSSVDAILFDLGFSSDQLAAPRGFSFQRDEPLDMRLSGQGPTAAEILNSWDEHAIELILRGFGEEKYSRRIAAEIVRRRELTPFKTTFDLVAAVEAAKPRSFRDKINPSTKTFQALRIAVNEELTALEVGLVKGWTALAEEGRLAVISFHSLEDRIVKNFFREKVKQSEAKLINKKPVTPSAEEVGENPRARSAKLRIIERLCKEKI